MNTELSELGKKQAKKLRDELPSHIDAVYSSPLKRALDTAKIATDGRVEEIKIKDALQEMNLGVLEGVYKSEITSDQLKMWKMVNKDDAYNGHQGETGLQVVKRVKRVLNEIIEEAEDNNFNEILIFSHYGILRAIVTRIFDFDMVHFDNAEIYTLKKTEDNWIFLS